MSDKNPIFFYHIVKKKRMKSGQEKFLRNLYRKYGMKTSERMIKNNLTEERQII